MTPFQQGVFDHLRPSGLEARSALALAAGMGYRPPHKGWLVVTLACTALKKQGLANDIPPKDQWATRLWYRT